MESEIFNDVATADNSEATLAGGKTEAEYIEMAER